MTLLDRYIARTIIISIMLVCAVIIGMQSFLLIIAQLQDVGLKNYTFLHAFLFALMALPAQFYPLFPMAGFLGAMIGLSKLSASSELIVMRSAGVSMQRIGVSVMKAGILMVILMTLLGEGLGPVLQQQADKMRHRDLHPAANHTLLHSIWLHQNNRYTHIHQLINQNTMQGVTQYIFSENGRLLQTSQAPRGKYVQGQWQLYPVSNTYFHHKHITASRENQANFDGAFQPNLQVQMTITSVQETLKDLYHTIQYRRHIGLGVNQFIFLFWQRVLQPLTTLIMIALAVPFVFGSYRQASMSVRIMTGILLGFVFYIMNQLFGPITLVYQFPPIFAALLPTCLFFAVAMILLWRVK